MKRSKILGNNRGFTLIELMIVIIIIGILSAIALPQFTKQADKARVKRTIAEIRNMKAAIDAYYAETGSFPTASNSTDNEASIASVLEDYGIKWTSIKDPWNNGYEYAFDEDNNNYQIISAGPEGTIGDNLANDICATNTSETLDGQEVDEYDKSATSGSSVPS